ISSLIVVDDDELKGLLTKHDLLALGLKCKKIKVKDMMTPEPMQVSSSERLISARNTMFEHNFSALPVVDDGQLVGLVDDEIIAEAFARLREKVPAKHQKRRLQEFYVGQVSKTSFARVLRRSSNEIRTTNNGRISTIMRYCSKIH
ncbi:MAG: CBS domain-containing protein, partial [Candidatus Heimdallarchaeota archaeon]